MSAFPYVKPEMLRFSKGSIVITYTFCLCSGGMIVKHRIFYCHSGQGKYEANGILYPFTAGTLIYLPAGTPYRYLFEQEIPVFSGCNFDFFQDHTVLNTPIPPVEHTSFQPENILEKQIFAEEDIFSRPLHLENVFASICAASQNAHGRGLFAVHHAVHRRSGRKNRNARYQALFKML